MTKQLGASKGPTRATSAGTLSERQSHDAHQAPPQQRKELPLGRGGGVGQSFRGYKQ